MLQLSELFPKEKAKQLSKGGLGKNSDARSDKKLLKIKNSLLKATSLFVNMFSVPWSSLHSSALLSAVLNANCEPQREKSLITI